MDREWKGSIFGNITAQVMQRGTGKGQSRVCVIPRQRHYKGVWTPFPPRMLGEGSLLLRARVSAGKECRGLPNDPLVVSAAPTADANEVTYIPLP